MTWFTLLILSAGAVLTACRSHESPDAASDTDTTGTEAAAVVDYDLDGRQDGMPDGMHLNDGFGCPLYDDPLGNAYWCRFHLQSYDVPDPSNNQPRVLFVSEDGGRGYVEADDDIKFWCSSNPGANIAACNPTDGWYYVYVGGLPAGEVLFTLVSHSSDEPRLVFETADDQAYDPFYWRDGQACGVMTGGELSPPGNNSCEGLQLGN